MFWHWVHRREVERLRGKLNRAKAASLSMQHIAEQSAEIRVQQLRGEYDARLATLQGELEANRAALMRSERERLDLQTKLLRVGFGVNPFAELVPAAHAPAPDTSPADATQEFMLRPDMSDEEVRRTFVQEGAAKYGPHNLRAIKKHVEMRQAEFYQHRTCPAILTAEEEAQRFQVQADIDAAIAEGRQNAVVGGAD